MKAIYLGLLSGGNYLGLIISSQLFCGAMVWAPTVQGLIIWGAITREAIFLFLGVAIIQGENYSGGHLSGRGKLSWGTIVRKVVIIGGNCPGGNYPWGNCPVPKNMFQFLQQINKTRVIKYGPLPTISWQIYLYPKQFLHFMASCSCEVHIFEWWNLVRTLQLVHNL